jgi:hypothetical protein
MVMLSVVMLSVVMLSVVMLSVVVLSVVMLRAVMLRAIMLNEDMPGVVMLSAPTFPCLSYFIQTIIVICFLGPKITSFRFLDRQKLV